MRKRKKRKVQIFIMYIIIWLLLICIGILLFLFISRNRRINITGKWEYTWDGSEGVIYSVNDWLDDKEDIPFEFTRVKVVLLLNEDGTYSSIIDEASKAQFEKDVYEYVKERFSNIVSSNLLVAGYEDTRDINDVSKELIEETIGGELGPYLEENGVKIVPELSHLDEFVSEGNYTFDKKSGMITFKDKSGNEYTEKVTVSDEVLVFTGDENGQYNPVTFAKNE